MCRSWPSSRHFMESFVRRLPGKYEGLASKARASKADCMETTAMKERPGALAGICVSPPFRSPPDLGRLTGRCGSLLLAAAVCGASGGLLVFVVAYLPLS